MTHSPQVRAVKESSRPPRFGARPALGLFLAFLLLGALYTAPLVLHLDDGLPFAAVPPEGRETPVRVQGDYLQFYYYLWLVRDRLLAGASFLRDPYQFAVDGPRLNLPNTFLPLALLYVPLSAIGPRLAYNLLVLLSFPLAGLAAALLAHRYGVGRWAALVAAAVFACLPYRVGTLLGGHPAGFAFFLVPLALWGLEGALAGSLAGGAWCAVALGSMAVVEPHFFLFAALGLPLYLLARVGFAGWTPDRLRIGAVGWVVALVAAAAAAAGGLALLVRRGFAPAAGPRLAIGVALALGVLVVWQWGVGSFREARRAARAAVGPLALAGVGAVLGAAFLLALRSLVLARSVAGGGRTLHEVLLFSPLPADFLARVNPSAGRAVYLGAAAVGLALAGLVALALDPPAPPRRILLAFGPFLALAGFLTLGPRAPGIPLFEAAFRVIPFWNFIRQPAKLQVVTGLLLAILAAVGAEALAARWRPPRVRMALAIALAVLIALEFHPWRPAGISRLPTAGAPYDVIRAIGPRVLYLPLWPGDSSYSALYLYATTLTRVPMLNGYSALIDRAYVSEVYRALEALNLGALGEIEYAVLRRYGVRQLVLDRDAFPPKVSPFGPAFTLASLAGSPYLEPVSAAGDGGPLRVFRLRAQPVAAPARLPRSPLGIYWEAESLRRDTGVVIADPEASNGRVVRGEGGRDRAGFLTFGPYRLLPAGSFRAVFHLRGRGAAVTLQVTAAGGTRVLGTRDVRLDEGHDREEPVPFDLHGPVAVEYRAHWDGRGWAAVDHVWAGFADEPDPAPAFEIEALPHELAERADPEASGGLAGHADPAATPRDRVWSGPLRRYPAGRYRLWVRLKIDRPDPGRIAWCGAQAASVGPVLGARELSGGDVGATGRYVELAVPFTLPRPMVLEFPCVYHGAVGVWFDRLRIEGPL